MSKGGVNLGPDPTSKKKPDSDLTSKKKPDSDQTEFPPYEI